MRDRLNRNAGLLTIVAMVVWFAFGFACGVAVAAPLTAHARQANLYGGTMADVRVCAKVKLERAVRAKVLIDTLDTRSGNWGGTGHPTIGRLRLEPGKRSCGTFTVEGLRAVFCAVREPYTPAECPRALIFPVDADAYSLVPAQFDRVKVQLTVGDRSLRATAPAKYNQGGAP